jgi:hypothetical protein
MGKFPKLGSFVYFRSDGNKFSLFFFISIVVELKISCQLSFPWLWKRKSAIDFCFRGCGSENQPFTFASVVMEVKISYRLSFRMLWK